MKHLVRVTPLEVKRNKKDTAFSIAYLEKGQKKVGDQVIETQDVKYMSSDVNVEAGKEHLLEVVLYAIDGDLIVKALRLAK